MTIMYVDAAAFLFFFYIHFVFFSPRCVGGGQGDRRGRESGAGNAKRKRG
jgi:hypothetical protein